jgi:hypothetical protein
LASNELGVQAFGLGNNGRNDLPGLPPEVFLSEDALPKVALLHSSRPSSALAKLLRGVAIPWRLLPLFIGQQQRCQVAHFREEDSRFLG